MIHPPSTTDLLRVWEEALGRPPVEAALALLGAFPTHGDARAVAQMSVGRRDEALLDLHECLFGPQLAGVAACPGCGEDLELSFQIADIRMPKVAIPAEPITVSVGDVDVEFCLPSSADVLAVAGQADVATAREVLLERCIVRIEQAGRRVPSGTLPPDVDDAVTTAMATADPQADVEVALACPSCGHAWTEAFDIAMFLLTEIDAWAVRLTGDVHVLASAYGWSETEILRLSRRRRELYLEAVGG